MNFILLFIAYSHFIQRICRNSTNFTKIKSPFRMETITTSKSQLNFTAWKRKFEKEPRSSADLATVSLDFNSE